MKKLITVLSMLFAVNVNAQIYYPGFGCFIQQGTSGVCSEGSVTCGNSTGRLLNYAYFGTTVGDLCDQVNSAKESWASCETASTANYNMYTTCFYANKATVKKSDALIKKLRKACGSKCKKIK